MVGALQEKIKELLEANDGEMDLEFEEDED